jgi:hypothetical protein
MASIAINGLGRIGRAAVKILQQAAGAEVVTVNDLVPPDNLTYLLRYDTVYGRWDTTVTADGDALVIGGRKVPVLATLTGSGPGGRIVRADIEKPPARAMAPSRRRLARRGPRLADLRPCLSRPCSRHLSLLARRRWPRPWTPRRSR